MCFVFFMICLCLFDQAYVTQDETLVTTLTVREAVYYSAELQLPASMSKAEKRERDDATIREMGLQGAMDTKIGSSWGPTGRNGARAISLGDPSVLFGVQENYYIHKS